MWAISRDRECWALKGDVQKVLTSKTLEPLEWIKIPGPGRMKTVSVSKTDLVRAVTNSSFASLENC